MATNRTNRAEALNAAGIDTSRFVIDLPNGMNAGSSITIDFNNLNDPVVNAATGDSVDVSDVAESGYIKNNKLHRRWVMAQMFRMLNSGDYSKYLKKNYGYMYQFSMLEDELNVLKHMEARDPESFRARQTFFTKGVVFSLFSDYLDKTSSLCALLKVRGDDHIWVSGIGRVPSNKVKTRVLNPIKNMLRRVTACNSYRELYNLVYNFNHQPHAKLIRKTSKCSDWVAAFKGSGAYYTLQNMILFHDVFIIDDNGNKLYGDDGMAFVDSKLDIYTGEGWRYLAMLKKVIADNNFHFGA